MAGCAGGYGRSALLASDRMFHSIPLLWRFHQIHHSTEELDWLAAYRVHPVDQIATRGISLAPVFALGFSDAAIVLFAMLYQWQAILIHSNISISFGPLRWLIASPDFHHWHHSKEVAARDKNFAGQLSLLDFLFGTAHMEDLQMAPTSGVGTDIGLKAAANWQISTRSEWAKFSVKQGTAAHLWSARRTSEDQRFNRSALRAMGSSWWPSSESNEEALVCAGAGFDPIRGKGSPRGLRGRKSPGCSVNGCRSCVTYVRGKGSSMPYWLGTWPCGLPGSSGTTVARSWADRAWRDGATSRGRSNR
jgi:hypothetical protein